MNIYKVKTPAEAFAAVKNGAAVLAGGTNLFVDFKKKGRPDGDFADIGSVAEWKQIERGADGTVKIGASVTFADILQYFDKATALYMAAYDMGSPQIRNRATVGGNLCDASPACDLGPVLLAADAAAELSSSDGIRQVPMTEFFKGYRKTALLANEILTGIILPDNIGKSVFRKIGLRNALAISVVSLAACQTESGVRLAMGSVAEMPVRLPHCEPLTRHKTIRRDDLRQALLSDIRPITDLRAAKEYRTETALRLLSDVLEKEYGYEII